MVETVPLPLQRWQRQLIALAWISYAAYYLGRVNLSPALPAMETDLGLSKEALGLLGTGFFWTYAIGQVINGQLGDLISPRRLVFFGMLASAAVNLAFGFSSSFALLLLLWGINGYCQATGWGPVLRTLSNWLSGAQRRRIATLFGTSYVLGNAAVLLFSGWLVNRWGWRAAFFVPAGLLALMACFWWFQVRDTPEERGYQRDWTLEPNALAAFNLRAVLAGMAGNFRRYWPLSLAGLFVGFCLIALNTWVPTYFVEEGGVAIDRAAALAALSPIAGSLGVILSSGLVNRFFAGRELYGLVGTLAGLILLFLAFPNLPAGLTLATLGLMVIGAFASATSSLTLSTLPLVLGDRQNASTLAGLIGFSINMGGGLSTLIVGGILDRFNWDAVFYALAACALLALLLVTLAATRRL
ncbi:MAG: MFS transporter [Ardenticatenales bacterium]|nr:MFS transporter [Ardenticatenales bacterium]